MFDPNKMSEEERQLLEEVAKAKGQTLEQALIELGHIKPPVPEQPVVFAGKSEPKPEPPLTVAPAPEYRPEQDPVVEFVPQVVPEFEPPPPPAAEFSPGSDDEEGSVSSGTGTLHQVCIQCGWDQDVPTIPEPEYQDKIGFLHSVLGHKVFTKRYSLFGGHLKLTLRTLTLREIDVLYQETFKAQKLGLIQTSADYYEYLNRQRLYLQLIGLVSQQTALHIKLPEGLSPEVHPEAVSYWETYLRSENAYKEDGESLMMQVQEYVVDKVLRTEHMHRAVTHTCNKFNRLVAKLEACVDDPNFWNETEPQS
jgi:hypothetical protein